MWVVYKHQNLQNGKVYIGITSRSIKERWRNGQGYVGKNGQRRIANAIKKYGWNGFSHEIIEANISTLEEAIEREKYWIKYYDSYAHGYNMSEGGSGTNTVRWKKVYQIDTNTLQIIKEYPSLYQAAAAINDAATNIQKCCVGKQKTAGGYYWSYSSDYGSCWLPPEGADRKQDIYQIDKVTLQIIKQWHGITVAANELKINHTHIISCCKGKRCSAGNYYWAYVDEYNEGWKPRERLYANQKYIMCVETGEKFISMAEAARQKHVSCSCICECCKDQNKMVKGLH